MKPLNTTTLFKINSLKTTIMKYTFFYLFALLLFSSPLVAQTPQNADPSAALEVNSTTKGFLPPRMTTVQRDAITTPATGLTIFNTNTNSLNYYDGSQWVAITLGSGGNSSADTDGDTQIQTEETADEDILRFDVAGTEAMSIDASGNVGIGTFTTPQAKFHVNASGSAGNETRAIIQEHDQKLLLGTRFESGIGQYSYIQAINGPETLNQNLILNRNGGNVGIGLTNPGERLHVIGNIVASGTITPDYVFEKYYEGESSLKADYEMPSLTEIEAFTRANKHLPGVLSAKDVEENGGILVNRATEINLEKIEELYLHTIEQQKQIDALKMQVEVLLAAQQKQ